jgi:proline dehydrogenase
MLRRLLLYLSTAGWARHIVTHWGLARRMARRFVAGETLDEAIAVIRTLQDKGILVTLDYLGESIASADDARHVVQTYCTILERLHDEGLHSTSISLKLTHLGLDISAELGADHVRQILEVAKTHGLAVTIDMESSAYTDTTLDIYRTLRDTHGFDNVGTVIQSYLYRSADDMHQLAAEGAHIRLCKGAYLEPPEVAFPDKADVDANFTRLTADYLLSPHPAYLCIATHDEQMIRAAEAVIQQHTIPSDRYEFQMLLGVRSGRQIELAAAGYKMRVYVPFGESWYPYFMRRLAERPANLWFILSNLFRR